MLKVKNPDYYNKGLEVMKFTNSLDLNFNLGCVVKYCCRAGLKDPKKTIEDFEKSKVYLDNEISRMEEFGKSANFFKGWSIKKFIDSWELAPDLRIVVYTCCHPSRSVNDLHIAKTHIDNEITRTKKISNS